MAKKKSTEDTEQSFEVLGTPYDQKEDVVASVHQVVEDMISSDPACGFKAKFHGEDQMTVFYHAYEMDLPSRIKQVEEQAEDRFKDFQKNLKKQYKEHTGHTLKLKELKDMRNHSVEKVSLNSRYYYRSWRVFELSL